VVLISCQALPDLLQTVRIVRFREDCFISMQGRQLNID
jgi:hypothetical protein